MSEQVNALTEITPSKYATAEMFAEIASASGFLPRLSLMNATSEPVKLDKIRSGYYGLVRSANDCQDLTKEVNCIPFSWRPKALNMRDKAKVIAAYNPASKLFLEIVNYSATPNSNCVYGPEFLIYIPSISVWATFHMSSKTSRRAAPEVKMRMDEGYKPITLKSTYIKQGLNSWWGPIVTDCSTPLERPDIEEIKKQVAKFNNVPDSEELKEEAPKDERPR